MPRQHAVLITGAAGHIGGKLLQHLSANSDLAIRPAFRSPLTLPGWAQHLQPTFGDLADEHVRSAALQNIDTVVHVATRGFSAAQPPSISELVEEEDITRLLAQDAARHGVATFIFISSIHVFGDALWDNVNDSTIPLPTTDYGISRLTIENQLLSGFVSTSMKTVILRMTNTFGVSAFPAKMLWSLFLHDLCKQVVEAGKIELRTNGEGYRNFLAVRDAVHAIAQVIETAAIPTGAYILGSPRTTQLKDHAALVSSLSQQELQISPTVAVNNDDMSTHRPFFLNSSGLTEHNIVILNRYEEELRSVLHFAQHEFGQ